MTRDLMEAFAPFEGFSKAMLDAYVIIAPNGKVVKCNQLFSTLTGIKSKKILQATDIDEVLELTISENPLKAKDLLQKKSPTRIDEVRGKTSTSSDLNLILGIHPFLNEDHVLGAFILIRDVTAETNLQDKYKVKATQSITDKLTGLYNRNYLEHYLENVLKSEIETQLDRPHASIIMADIDHFKAVNDTYGHQAGDQIIESVAKIFQVNFRKTDILCRYGGEEFLAILPTTELEGAYKAAEKFREAVYEYRFQFESQSIEVTISIGLTQISSHLENPTRAIARADRALYEAKNSGRNQVCSRIDEDTPDLNQVT